MRRAKFYAFFSLKVCTKNTKYFLLKFSTMISSESDRSLRVEPNENAEELAAELKETKQVLKAVVEELEHLTLAYKQLQEERSSLDSKQVMLGNKLAALSDARHCDKANNDDKHVLPEQKEIYTTHNHLSRDNPQAWSLGTIFKYYIIIMYIASYQDSLIKYISMYVDIF